MARGDIDHPSGADDIDFGQMDVYGGPGNPGAEGQRYRYDPNVNFSDNGKQWWSDLVPNASTWNRGVPAGGVRVPYKGGFLTLTPDMLKPTYSGGLNFTEPGRGFRTFSPGDEEDPRTQFMPGYEEPDAPNMQPPGPVNLAGGNYTGGSTMPNNFGFLNQLRGGSVGGVPMGGQSNNLPNGFLQQLMSFLQQFGGTRG